MAAFVKFNRFIRDIAEGGVHNLSTAVYKIAAVTAVPAATLATLAEVTELAEGNGYTAGGETLQNVAAGEVGGVFTVDADNPTITAAGGNLTGIVGWVLYNDAAAADQLIGFYAEPAPLTIEDGSDYTLRFDGAGIFTLS